MQRSQVIAVLDRLKDLFVNTYGAGKILSAMNHTVSYRINFLKGTYHSHLLIGKLFYYQLHRRSVIRHIRFLLHLVTACRLMGDVAAVNSDSFT